jgi:signal transduction histidine kinase
VAERAEIFEVPLWRALAVFRLASLGYAALLVAKNFGQFSHPMLGWLVIAVMAGWTVVTIYGYQRPRWRGWPLLIADLLVGAGTVLVSPAILGPGGNRLGLPSIPVAWIAGPVVAWAITGGRRRGTVAALLMGAASLVVFDSMNLAAINTSVLLLLAGIAVGHVARLAVEAEQRLQRAAELEAATRERERLARGIHDSVLQVLALVQRRGTEIGGDAAELGRLAGEQEAALRVLVGTPPPTPGGTDVDLRGALGRYASPTVSLSTPAHPVLLPARTAEEIVAAVAAALSNVAHHCGPGAPAWVLVEQEAAEVTVTVRDEGPGISPGRLDEAAADGRLGVAQSIRGRVRDLGGTVTITSAPGQGTEVELRVPVTAAPAGTGRASAATG